MECAHGDGHRGEVEEQVGKAREMVGEMGMVGRDGSWWGWGRWPQGEVEEEVGRMEMVGVDERRWGEMGMVGRDEGDGRWLVVEGDNEGDGDGGGG